MKKRFLPLLLALLCTLTLLSAASAETAYGALADLPDAFIFMGGAGGWSTRVQIHADGSFSGLYEDWNMGDITDEHPNGSLYQCRFSGTFAAPEAIDAHEYSLKIDTLTLEGTEGEEQIVDGVKIVTAAPYGFENADEFRLYLPGRDSTTLPQAYVDSISPALSWEWENHTIPSPLTFHGLYNIGGQQGFFGSDGASWESESVG